MRPNFMWITEAEGGRGTHWALHLRGPTKAEAIGGQNAYGYVKHSSNYAF